MTGKAFLNNMANGKVDVVQLLLDLLEKLNVGYCVIGGLAVNAYAEPVASLDLDIILSIDNMERFLEHAKNTFSITKFSHSVNLQHAESDLRIQLQTDPIYQSFIQNASIKEVLGYQMKVASLEDVLKGKIWAYSDKERRIRIDHYVESKRQKDLADIMRLVETHTYLINLLPEEIKSVM